VVVAGGSPNPNIIGARLRAAAMAPPSAHPDADLLTAFAEQCLNDLERARILEHLAQCTVCRDVVYFAQPEEEATLKPVQSPVSTHWFAGRRLQWAALAASVSMIAAIAIYVKTNPERMPQYAPAIASPAANKEAQPQGNAQNETAGASYSTSPAAQSAEKPDAMRRESSLKAAEAEQKAISGGAGSLGKLSRDDADEARAKTFYKTNGTLDDKEAAKQASAYSYGDVETGKKGGTAGEVNGLVAANGSTTSEKDRLFDLRQQKAHGGPYVNSSNANSNQIQNQANLDLYRNANGYTADIPAAPSPSASAAASPLAKSDSVEISQSSSTPASSTSASITSGTRSAAAQAPAPPKPVAVTHGVVPAEEARKKKLETIPAQSTAQATEETVAVAGQAQDIDRVGEIKISDQSARTSKDLPLNGRSATTLATLAPGAAGTTAITGWRIHHGRVQERLYGIWHDAVVAAQQTSVFGAAGRVTAAPSQRFAGIAALGADVWTVQAIGRGQSSLVLYHSRDAGVSWQPSILTAPGTVNPGAQVSVKFIDSQQGEVTLSTGEKWQTSDGGAQWKFVK
jgi:hypothetical protein